MFRNRSSAVVCSIFVAILAVGTGRRVHGQDSKNRYSNMASLDQYLMADRDAEIALARSAAPPSISSAATVMVLGRRGYETAVEGKNGFVCIVERAWMGAFDSPEFWNAKNRGPSCFNPQAARSVLPITLKRTDLVLAGKSREEIKEGIKAAIESKELPVLEPGAMTYMMSKQGRLNDRAGHWVPHLMFYVPVADNMTLGADMAGSPVLMNPHFNGAPEPVTEFMVPVSEWSDGTPAAMVHQ